MFTTKIDGPLYEGLPEPVEKSGEVPPTDWATQRSDLRSIIVTFSEDVDITAADLQLTNLGINAPEDPDFVVPIQDEYVTTTGNTITIEFPPMELPDGVYQLVITPNVADAAGNQLDGNGDGIGGDAFIHEGSASNGFFKLKGDFNGDGGVSMPDMPGLVYWFGESVPAAPSFADLNTDGGVSVLDYAEFVGCLGNAISFPESVELSIKTFIPGLEPRPGYHSTRGVALSPDESTLYAAYWTAGTAYPAGGEPIGVYSTTDHSLIDKMQYGGCHGDVVISPDGRYAYTPSYYEGNVSRFDLANGNTRTSLPAGSWAQAIGLSPDGTKLVVGSGSDGYPGGPTTKVSIYDVSGNTFSLLGSVQLADEPQQQICFSPNSEYVYVPTRSWDSTPARLYEVSLTSPFQVAQWEDIEGSTRVSSVVTDGETLFVSDYNLPNVWTLDTATMTQTGSIDVPFPPSYGGMAIHPDGEHLFVLHGDDAALSVMDFETHSVVGSFDGLIRPTDIQFTSDGKTAYVAEYSMAGGGIAVLDVGIEDRGIGSDTLTVTVANAASTVDAGLDQEASNGDQITLRSDARGESLLAIQNTSPDSSDEFGRPLAVVGDNIHVGATRDDTRSSNAGIPDLSDGKTGELPQTFPDADNPTHPTLSSGDGFGEYVASIEDSVPIGATLADAGSNTTVSEEGAFAGSDSFREPGTDTWTATLDYGDGSGTERKHTTEQVVAGIAFDPPVDAAAAATDRVLSQGTADPLASLYWADFTASDNTSSKPKKNKATDLALMMMME